MNQARGTQLPLDTVVVAGASISGLMMARTLSERFTTVIVFDRDELPAEPQLRPGVPQAPHAHAVLSAARFEIERQFPGFTEEAQDRGAVFVQATMAQKLWGRFGVVPNYESDLMSLQISRTLLEWMIRNRVRDIVNVTIVPSTRVVGLVSTVPDTVTGVRIENEEGAASTSAADLVIDASGRSSRAPHWVQELGYDAPEDVTVNAFAGYSSVLVRPREEVTTPFVSIGGAASGVGTGPSRHRGGIVSKQEDGLWILSLGGFAKDHPPKDEAGMRAFADSIGRPEFSSFIAGCDFVTEPQQWRATANRMRHWADLARRPECFVAVGDAVACLNPLYGQGMSLATWAARDMAVELDAQRALRPDGSLVGLAERYQRRLEASLQMPWMMSTSADYLVDGAEGPPRTGDGAAALEYTKRLRALATEDSSIALRLTEMAHLIRGPEWMEEPDVRRRVESNWQRLGDIWDAAGEV